MNDTIPTAEQALAALIAIQGRHTGSHYETIRARLEATCQPAQAVAWLHEVTEPNASARFMFSREEESPWSHWRESYKRTCVFKKTPLYAAPPSLPDEGAARAKALEEVARLCDAKAAMYDRKSLEPTDEQSIFARMHSSEAMEQLSSEIRALIGASPKGQEGAG